MTKKLSYHDSVNYSQADPMKVLAQQQGLETVHNLPQGFTELNGTRGESAYVFDMGNMWGALVQEGLGTKSLIAQSIYESTGKNHFAAIAQDTVACIINDLISVGATPVVLNAYWTSSSYAWLTDHNLAEEFIKGWRMACDKAKVVWGGGETQSLSGIIEKDKLEFAGSAFGVITSKQRLIQDKHLRSGDAIVLIESNGVHANGISLAREIANTLPDGYSTTLKSGLTYGEVLLQPTHIYTALVEGLFEADVDIHYLSNITGHGWRKLMRSNKQLSYVIDHVPEVPEIFEFIAEKSVNTAAEMYGNYNMGTGYAVYVPLAEVDAVIKVAAELKLQAWRFGSVEAGPKQVIIKPKDIVFKGDTLGVR